MVDMNPQVLLREQFHGEGLDTFIYSRTYDVQLWGNPIVVTITSKHDIAQQWIQQTRASFLEEGSDHITRRPIVGLTVGHWDMELPSLPGYTYDAKFLLLCSGQSILVFQYNFQMALDSPDFIKEFLEDSEIAFVGIGDEVQEHYYHLMEERFVLVGRFIDLRNPARRRTATREEVMDYYGFTINWDLYYETVIGRERWVVDAVHVVYESIHPYVAYQIGTRLRDSGRIL